MDKKINNRLSGLQQWAKCVPAISHALSTLLPCTLIASDALVPVDEGNTKCGIYSAYFALTFHEKDTPLAEIEKAIPRNADGGVQMSDIYDFLLSRGLSAKAVQCTVKQLKQHKGGFILHFKFRCALDSSRQERGHFCFAVYDKEKDAFLLADPIRNFHLITVREKYLQEKWSSCALLLD